MIHVTNTLAQNINSQITGENRSNNIHQNLILYPELSKYELKFKHSNIIHICIHIHLRKIYMDIDNCMDGAAESAVGADNVRTDSETDADGASGSTTDTEAPTEANARCLFDGRECPALDTTLFLATC